MPISGAGVPADQGHEAALAIGLGVLAGSFFTIALIARRRSLG
jgi:hypothetical protein